VTVTVRDPSPALGDLRTAAVTLTDDGPDAATGVDLTATSTGISAAGLRTMSKPGHRIAGPQGARPQPAAGDRRRMQQMRPEAPTTPTEPKALKEALDAIRA
jgi:hypothetical protein